MFTPMHEIVPPGESDGCVICHREVSKEQSWKLGWRPMQYTPPGTYVELRVRGRLMMSDVRNEKISNMEVVLNSHGDVLIAGLGVGMILVPILKREEVNSVLVLEKEKGVVDLVVPALEKHIDPTDFAKLEVIVTDALQWRPPKGRKWDTIYFDIWPDVDTNNLEEVTILRRRYAKRRNPGAWVSAWMEQTLRNQRRRDREDRYGFRCGGRW